MGSESEHPALENFSETKETVMETGKGALGGAVKGGLLGGLALGGLALAAPLALAAIPVVGWVAAPLGVAASAGSGLALGAGIAGAKVGGMIGGAWGGGSALLGAGEKVEEKKQRMIENFERNETLQERREAVKMRSMAMQQGTRTMGVTPNALPGQQMSTGQQLA